MVGLLTEEQWEHYRATRQEEQHRSSVQKRLSCRRKLLVEHNFHVAFPSIVCRPIQYLMRMSPTPEALFCPVAGKVALRFKVEQKADKRWLKPWHKRTINSPARIIRTRHANRDSAKSHFYCCSFAFTKRRRSNFSPRKISRFTDRGLSRVPIHKTFFYIDSFII